MADDRHPRRVPPVTTSTGFEVYGHLVPGYLQAQIDRLLPAEKFIDRRRPPEKFAALVLRDPPKSTQNTRGRLLGASESREVSVARLEGVEPPARGFEGRCSIQLSYRRVAAILARQKPRSRCVRSIGAGGDHLDGGGCVI